MNKEDAEKLAQTMSESCLAVRVRLLSRVVTALYDGELRALGLKANQCTMLVCLARLGQADQTKIGRALNPSARNSPSYSAVTTRLNRRTRTAKHDSLIVCANFSASSLFIMASDVVYTQYRRTVRLSMATLDKTIRIWFPFERVTYAASNPS
jgi:hypothetical protein